MIFDQTKAEGADKVCLIGAMMRIVEEEPFDFDMGLLNLVENVAVQATMVVSLHHNEGDGWDGVLWMERLSEYEPGSLAWRLVEKMRQDGESGLYTSAVENTLEWMRENGIPVK